MNIITKLLKKFQNAINGFFYTFKEESSLQIEILISIITIVLGFIFKISLHDWVAIIIVIFLVLSFELMNTGIENMLDLVSYKYNINIKKIKDIFAAATLLVSFGSVIVGCIIFIPIFIHY